MEYLKAFIAGGLVCVVGQILIDTTKLTAARILTGYVVAGVILGGTGLYEPFAKWAGAGASVPLLGFGHLLQKGVKEAVVKHGWLGILSGGLTACAAGVAIAIFAALVISLIFKPGDKT